MVLAELLEGVPVVKLVSSYFGKMALTQDLSIKSIQYDSRKVGQGDLFVAITGTVTDGHRYLEQAIDRGAVAIVVENDAALPDTYCMHTNVFKILVPDSRMALARMAATLHGHPSQALALVGVTGTNGKTTTTHLIRSVLEAAGMRTGLLGTIGNLIGNRALPATHTTPESLELNALLAEMVREGCGAAVMEVSSHALLLHRVHGLRFSAALFTNLTQDHLDFHGTMESYFAAKKRLFDMLDDRAAAATNLDDEQGRSMVAHTRARVVTYGVQTSGADVTARDVRMDVHGISLKLVLPGAVVPVTAQLTGRFNVENILAAAAACTGLGIPAPVIARGIASLETVRGRFEQFSAPGGWTVVVDYAHTPDALEKCLHTIRDLLPAGSGRVITVFGCGGDRDRTKRPIMGRIAVELSDLTIVTSDNPRTEDPERIIDEIMAGVPSGSRCERITDRRAAIDAAMRLARPGDIVLVAGKGHEDYQVIGTTKQHFDDRAEVLARLH